MNKVKTLRLGVVLPERAPLWCRYSVELLACCEGCEMVLIGYPFNPVSASQLFNVYKALEKRLFIRGEHPADVVPVIDFPKAASLHEVESLNCDLLYDPLNLLEGAAAVEAQTRWSIVPAGAAVALAEVTAEAPFVEVALVQHTPLRTAILTSSKCPCDRRSVLRTQAHLLWRAAELPARVISQFASGTPDLFTASSVTQESREETGVLPLGAYVAARYARDVVRRRTHPTKWCIAWQEKTGSGSPRDMNPIAAPHGISYADPFPFERNGLRGIFLEEAPAAGGKAHISYLPWNIATASWGPAVPIISEPFHLSYPFILEFEDVLYLIPESSETNEIRLYRCEEYPLKWRFDRILMKGTPAVDSTLIRHDGLWWLFAGMSVGRSLPDELHIYYGKTPFGPFQSHRLNPVVPDLCRARPAGRMFQENGLLIRPSQDSSYRYGRALVFHRVNELTTHGYREVEVRRIEPDWDPKVVAVHTWNESESLRCIDTMRIFAPQDY